MQLDHYLNDKLLAGEAVDDHRQLTAEVISIVQKLGQAKLGHSDLHLGNFLLQDGKLFLLDAYAIHRGGMTTEDILRLGLSVSRFATKTDVLRGWRVFTDAPLPHKNGTRRRQWRKFKETSLSENRYFSRLRLRDGWNGHVYRHAKFPRRWALLSKIDVDPNDVAREWDRLLQRIESDQFEILKRSKSGDVFAGEIVLGGKPISVIIKRNRRRVWYRYLNEIGRGSRSLRAWKKAWSLIVRDIPTAWPLLVAEKRVMGYVVDSFIIFERVRGTQLHDFDLSTLDAPSRENLFRRLGRTLRLLEAQGLKQYDSKATNWIIVDDPKLGPVPVIVDVDGIRRITPPNWPIDRLLRSMREHPQYTPTDSKELCLGYAPYAWLMQEPAQQPIEDPA
jgi:tRNA A-37 threonylcarbamoyl transferase component Bud32